MEQIDLSNIQFAVIDRQYLCDFNVCKLRRHITWIS